MKTSHSSKVKAEAKVADAPTRLATKEAVFSLLVGALIGLSVVKFGNPVILDSKISAPTDLAEFLIFAWPIRWGYVLLGGLVLASFALLRPRMERRQWPIWLIAGWLFWQFLSSTRTVNKELTAVTLAHFVSCCVFFLIGWWALARVRLSGYFWVPILVCLGYVLFTGFDQQHGGLDAMRKEFFAQPDWQSYPKEYIAKMETKRIWATLVYPNALAGAILLFFPITAFKLWELTVRWPRVLRGVALGLYGYLSLGCLYWSGSKGGWLIALGLIAVGLLHLRFSARIKIALLAVGLVLGLGAFFIRFSGYFERGATSVSARFTYWWAAKETVKQNPIFGSGPGTFSVMYARIKPPEAEMARLTHNDFLEQASDSGILGAVAYGGFILISLWKLHRKCAARPELLLLWLGLFAWAIQSFIEFPLYIPALSWPVFLFLGWLWGQAETEQVKNA